MGSDPPVGEGPRGVSPPGVEADGGHGTQTSTGWDMGVPTHWCGAVNVGAGLDWCVYLLPPEHGCTIHFDSSYHVLVYGGTAEDGNEPIQVMVI